MYLKIDNTVNLQCIQVVRKGLSFYNFPIDISIPIGGIEDTYVHTTIFIFFILICFYLEILSILYFKHSVILYYVIIHSLLILESIYDVFFAIIVQSS